MQSYAFSGASQIYYLVFILVILGFIVYRRINTLHRGRKLSRRSLVRLPVIYTFLTLLFLYGLNILFIIIAVIVYAIGIPSGYLLAGDTKIFKREEIRYYKSSIAITLIWMVLFAARVVIEIFAPQNVLLAGITGVLLAFSAGLFIGEALLVSRQLKIKV